MSAQIWPKLTQNDCRPRSERWKLEWVHPCPGQHFGTNRSLLKTIGSGFRSVTNSHGIVVHLKLDLQMAKVVIGLLVSQCSGPFIIEGSPFVKGCMGLLESWREKQLKSHGGYHPECLETGATILFLLFHRQTLKDITCPAQAQSPQMVAILL